MTFPPFMLGTMYYGTRIDRETSLRMLDMYVDRGFDFIDTANNYAFWITGTQGGESELLIGEWLASRGHDRLRIATKVGARPRFAGGDLSSFTGLSRDAIRDQAEESLQRLGIDHVDLLYAHIDDHTVPFEESFAALDALVQKGSTRTIGISNLVNERLTRALDVVEAHGFAPVRALQQRYSALAPAPGGDLRPHIWAGDDIRATLEAHDVELVAYSPLAEGRLGTTEIPLQPAFDCAENEARRQELAKDAAERGLTLSQYALRWLTDQGITPVVGARTPEQLEDAMDAFA